MTRHFRIIRHFANYKTFSNIIHVSNIQVAFGAKKKEEKKHMRGRCTEHRACKITKNRHKSLTHQKYAFKKSSASLFETLICFAKPYCDIP